jgi:hypothetical protein
MMMETLRKGFYVLDLLVLALMMVCINHTMAYETEGGFLALDVALLLRFNITFLLYRRERMSIIPIVIFTVLFGDVVLSGDFQNAIYRMSEYPSIVLNTQPLANERFISMRYPSVDFIVRCIIYWAWLMPIAVYAVLAISLRTVNNQYKWYHFAGLAIFKDKAGKLLVNMCVVAIIALLIGYTMDETLSFYAMMVLPMVAYYLLNKYVGRKVHWLEYVLLGVGLYVFDKAQYKVDNERVEYVLVSAAIILAVCVWMLYMTKKVAASIFALVVMAVVLPGLSIGYNIYQSMEGARSMNYVSPGMQKGYFYIRRVENVNGKQKMRIGIRDRYRTTVPCKFNIILPDGFYSPFALCKNEKGDSVYYNVEAGYIFEKNK